MPQIDYETGKKTALCFFPLVGASLGLLFWLWTQLALRLGINRIPFALLNIALFIFFTGGIHLDGFMDVSDAITSGKCTNGKLTVLKDPHIGAFAVIRTIILVLLTVAFFAEVAYDQFLFIAAGFTLSRLVVVITIKKMKAAASTGMLARLQPNRRSPFVEVFLLVILLTGLAILYPWETLILAVSSSFLVWRYTVFTRRHFGGISGDTCGWLLTVFETVVVFSAAMITWIR